MKRLMTYILALGLAMLLLGGCAAESGPLPDQTGPAAPTIAGEPGSGEATDPSGSVVPAPTGDPVESVTPAPAAPATEPAAPATTPTDSEKDAEMQMKIGDVVVTVAWEDNDSVDALRKLVEKEPLTIAMSMYGGFEQVGSLGQRLPRADTQTTTEPGDIVLYSGNQIVVFYGSNSWAYTRLGHITDKTADELTALLGNGNVTITIGKGL